MSNSHLKQIKYTDVPSEYLDKIKVCPTEPFYFVVDEEAGEEYGMNDPGGRKQYGPDWDLIKENIHPDFRV